MILPAALREPGDALSVAFGHADPGVSTFVAPLSADGQEPATHFATHTWASAQFIADLDAAQAATFAPLPPGVNAQELAALITAMTRSARPGEQTPSAHFEAVLAAHGLQRVMPGGEIA